VLPPTSIENAFAVAGRNSTVLCGLCRRGGGRRTDSHNAAAATEQGGGPCQLAQLNGRSVRGDHNFRDVDDDDNDVVDGNRPTIDQSVGDDRPFRPRATVAFVFRPSTPQFRTFASIVSFSLLLIVFIHCIDEL